MADQTLSSDEALPSALRRRISEDLLADLFRERLQGFIGDPLSEEARIRMRDELVSTLESLRPIVSVVDAELLEGDRVRCTVTLDPLSLR